MWKLLNFLRPTPLGMATMGDGRADNSPEDMHALLREYAQARAANAAKQGTLAAPAPPPTPVAAPAGYQSGPTSPIPSMSAPQAPWWANEQGMHAPAPTVPSAPQGAGGGAPMPQPAPRAAPVPMPMARPADAPSPPPVQQQASAGPQFDLATGTFGYPTNQQNGSALIAKMMGLMHRKTDDA